MQLTSPKLQTLLLNPGCVGIAATSWRGIYSAHSWRPCHLYIAELNTSKSDEAEQSLVSFPFLTI